MQSTLPLDQVVVTSVLDPMLLSSSRSVASHWSRNLQGNGDSPDKAYDTPLSRTQDCGILCPIDPMPPYAILGLSSEEFLAAAGMCTYPPEWQLGEAGVDKACSCGLCVHTCLQESPCGKV